MVWSTNDICLWLITFFRAVEWKNPDVTYLLFVEFYLTTYVGCCNLSFTYHIGLSHSHIFVNIMELYATGIQMRGLDSYKQGVINHVLLDICLYLVKNGIVVSLPFDVFELLIRPFNKGLSDRNLHEARFSAFYYIYWYT